MQVKDQHGKPSLWLVFSYGLLWSLPSVHMDIFMVPVVFLVVCLSVVWRLLEVCTHTLFSVALPFV